MKGPGRKWTRNACDGVWHQIWWDGEDEDEGGDENDVNDDDGDDEDDDGEDGDGYYCH